MTSDEKVDKSYDNPTCANGCQVPRKVVLNRDALFMDWIGLGCSLAFLSSGHPLTLDGGGFV